MPHIQPCNIRNRSGQLNSGWPPANDDEIKRRMPAMLNHVPLSQLKG